MWCCYHDNPKGLEECPICEKDREENAEEQAEYQQELAALKQQREDLITYLNSDKFSKDTTVQVVDVLTRLGVR